MMLTGETRYRIGWRNKLILQVQVWRKPFATNSHTPVSPYSDWRDATVEDMQEIERGRIAPNMPGPNTIPPPPPPRNNPIPQPNPVRRDKAHPNSNPPPSYDKPPPPPPPPISIQPREVISGVVQPAKKF